MCLLPAAIVAAAAGVPILLHGYDDVPGRLATATVAARLGIPIDLDLNRRRNASYRKGWRIWTSASTIRSYSASWNYGKSLACGASSSPSPHV